MRWLFLLLFFAGCARLPQNEICSVCMDTPCLETSVAAAVQELPFTKGDFPDEYWWQCFEDCQLSALVERALANQPSLQRAEARVRIAQETAAIQRSSLFPTIGLSGQAAQQYFSKNSFFRAYAPMIPGRINEYIVELDFSYEFDFWGKNQNLLRAALGEAQASLAEACQTKIMLSTMVVLTYFNWQVEKKRYALLHKQQKLNDTSLQLTKFLYGEGLGNREQLFQAEMQELYTAKQLVQIEEILQILQNQLKMLLGLGPDDPLVLEEHSLPEDIRIALPSHLSCNLLARRPDLLALIWRAEAAAKRIGAAKADFYPNVNIMGLIGLDSVFFRKLFSVGSQTAAATPAFYLPIFTGGRLRAQLKKRQAEFDEAIFAYNEKLLEVVREVADQIASVQALEREVTLQRKIVRDQAEIHSLIAHKTRAGISSDLEAINAKQILLQEQDIALVQTLQKLCSIINLIKALGGGFHCS